MQFYRKKGVLQILDNSVTGARNARTEGALGISQFNHHHSTPQFIDRETEVMRGKAYTGHRERKRDCKTRTQGSRQISLVLLPSDHLARLVF